MNVFTVQIASLPDRDNIVAEIWFADNQVAELFIENNSEIQIEIFPAPDGGVWSFSLEELISILLEAKKNLLA